MSRFNPAVPAETSRELAVELLTPLLLCSAVSSTAKLTRVYFFGSRLKIVDDDIDWKQMVTQQTEIEEDEEEAPVVS